jgi:hypothetical protein
VREKNQITSGGRYVHLPGQSVTRLTAYHISWHVASTFKRLATTTTHCDLINIDEITFRVMILHMIPSMILIVTVE